MLPKGVTDKQKMDVKGGIIEEGMGEGMGKTRKTEKNRTEKKRKEQKRKMRKSGEEDRWWWWWWWLVMVVMVMMVVGLVLGGDRRTGGFRECYGTA
ncbi:hypothetical protein M0804_010912 [Polistes exclamans]|nr:hypothetical protein M0804_010912 [Polistes exclamans]